MASAHSPQLFEDVPRSQEEASESEASETESEAPKGRIADMEADVRRGFVRKVYGILSAQLAFTFVVAAPFPIFLGPDFLRTPAGTSLYYLCLTASLGLIFGLACCCQEAARQYPTNYIWLFAFTLVQSILVGMITCIYTTSSVLLAVASTAVVFFSLTAYACFTKSDFTGFGPYLFAGIMCLMSFGLVLSIWSCFAQIPSWLATGHSLLGVLLFSFYIIYDTQMILGGRHKKHQFDVDDYVFAALNLYLDIINLFLYMLSLLGSRN